MIIRINQASCKWSSGWTGLLQMIIRMDRPLANDHPDGPASCNWSEIIQKRFALFSWSCSMIYFWQKFRLNDENYFFIVHHWQSPLVKPVQLNFFFLLLEIKFLTNKKGEEFVGQHQRKPTHLSSPEEAEDMQTTPSKQVFFKTYKKLETMNTF